MYSFLLNLHQFRKELVQQLQSAFPCFCQLSRQRQESNPHVLLLQELRRMRQQMRVAICQ